MFTQQAQAVIDRVNQLRHEVDDHWQVPADEARLLAHLALAVGARSALEVGVSYGFSTLHLASAMRHTGGHIHAIDVSPKKIDAATRHLTEAGLIDRVTLHLGDAREVISGLKPSPPFDFVFLDAVKDQTLTYFEAAVPMLGARCAIATDNTRSHPDQLAHWVAHARSLDGFTSCDVPIGNGLEWTVRLPK